MIVPKRIQRRRTKGWRKPGNCMIVDRTSRYGNPFRPFGTTEVRRDWFESVWNPTGETIRIHCGDVEHCVALFRAYALQRAKADPGWLRPLRGMDVACACPEDKVHCHGDVLLELANREEPTE